MKKISKILLLIILAAATPLAAEELSIPTPPWNEFLKGVGLTVKDSQLPEGRWRAGGRYSLPVFNKVWNDWTQLQPEAVKLTNSLQKADSFASLLMAGAAELNVKIPNVPSTPDAETPDKAAEFLVKSIVAIHTDSGKSLTPEQLVELKTAAGKVPANVAMAASRILGRVPFARRAWETGCGLPKPKLYDKAMANKIVEFGLRYFVDKDILDILDNVNLARMLQGGLSIAEAIDNVVEMPGLDVNEKFSFTWNTPYGLIVLNGNSDDVYDQPQYLLIYDTGGNDVYKAPADATATFAGRVSVVIDLAGNDKYTAENKSPWGAGICGYGFLWDRSGDDVYTHKFLGPAAAILGVSVCVDSSGNDKYDGEMYTQGAAAIGVAVLADCNGDDVYKCYQASQGFAKTKGCGILLDRAGSDVYDANNTDIKYPSAQTPKGNASLSQGMGFGRRAHPGDGNSLAGGVGCLLDFAGDDKYTCGLFGQGASYWYSLGIHVDLGGNDYRYGWWYVQGIAVHHAACVFLDVAGNDEYIATMGQNLGHSKDNSVAFLYEAAGDDKYVCTGEWTLGSAWWRTIAVFFDAGGKDEYHVGGTDGAHTIGAVAGGKCLGVFTAAGDNKWTGELQPLKIKNPVKALPDGKGQQRIGKCE